MILSPEARGFLSQPRLARMSVIDSDGFPHTVPVWYDVDGDSIVIISVRSTQKVSYIEANASGNVVIGGDAAPDGGYGSGYLIKGAFAIEEDTDLRWMKHMIYRYESDEKAKKDAESWAKLDMIVIRLTPQEVISFSG